MLIPLITSFVLPSFSQIFPPLPDVKLPEPQNEEVLNIGIIIEKQSDLYPQSRIGYDTVVSLAAARTAVELVKQHPLVVKYVSEIKTSEVHYNPEKTFGLYEAFCNLTDMNMVLFLGSPEHTAMVRNLSGTKKVLVFTHRDVKFYFLVIGSQNCNRRS